MPCLASLSALAPSVMEAAPFRQLPPDSSSRQLPPDSFQSQQLLSQQLDVLPSFQLFPPDSSSLSTTPSRPTAASLHRQLRPTASSVSPFRQLPSQLLPAPSSLTRSLPTAPSLSTAPSLATASRQLDRSSPYSRQLTDNPSAAPLPTSPDLFTAPSRQLLPTAPNPSSSFHNNNA